MAAVTPEEQDDAQETVQPSRRRALIWVIVLLGMIGIVLFSLPFINILFTIINPPLPPLPNVARIELSRENYNYGVDEFVFQTSAEPCSIITFYQELGAVCRVTLNQCGNVSELGEELSGNQLLARCEGTLNVSQFSMDWWVLISRSPTDNAVAQLNVWREMNWLGQTGSATATP